LFWIPFAQGWHQLQSLAHCRFSTQWPAVLFVFSDLIRRQLNYFPFVFYGATGSRKILSGTFVFERCRKPGITGRQKQGNFS
jgi:hypothetical protein